MIKNSFPTKVEKYFTHFPLLPILLSVSYAKLTDHAISGIGYRIRLYANEIGSRNYSYHGFLSLKSFSFLLEIALY